MLFVLPGSGVTLTLHCLFLLGNVTLITYVVLPDMTSLIYDAYVTGYCDLIKQQNALHSGSVPNLLSDLQF
jgi:hypothetical protein